MRKISVLLLLAIAGCATPVPTRESIRDAYSPNYYQCPVTVNYRVTVDSLIKDGQHDGKYFLLNPNINSKNFSLTVTGEKKIIMQFAHFDKKPMTHLEILAALKKRHLRPANTQEFLCLVQRYNKELWKLVYSTYIFGDQIEIICLGASYQPKNSFYSEVLHWRISDNMPGLEGIPMTVLDLTFLELNWFPDSYFAVVSTDSQEEDLDFKPKTIEFK